MNASGPLKAMLKSGREQNVWTPPLILEPIRALWGEIVLDPCAPSCGSNPVGAVHTLTAEQDGLQYIWPDRTFVNPAYKTLRPWLHHVHIDAEARVAWLVPVRPNRKWWRAWARDQLDEAVYLNPLAFAGHKDKFPAPLCLGLKGPGSVELAHVFATHGLGETI